MLNTLKTVPERIADELSERILSGDFQPGSRLPSVRKLAAAYEVNVSTIQRVLVVLEERGLALAKDRAGIEVLDAGVTGGTALWPILLASEGAQDRASALLRDALHARRLLAVSVLRQLGQVDSASFLPALESAVRRFAETVARDESDLGAVSAAETSIIRTLLMAANRPAVLAIFNDISGMLGASPGVLKAVYSDPQLTLGAWRAFLAEARDGDIGRYGEMAATVLEAMDENIIAAFRAKQAEKPTQEQEC